MDTFDSSKKVSVPGDWNYRRPEWFHYEGPAWFSRVFSYIRLVGRRVFAYLAGADKSVEVWCNGHGPIGCVNGPGALWAEITDDLIPLLNFYRSAVPIDTKFSLSYSCLRGPQLF